MRWLDFEIDEILGAILRDTPQEMGVVMDDTKGTIQETRTNMPQVSGAQSQNRKFEGEVQDEPQSEDSGIQDLDRADLSREAELISKSKVYRRGEA